MFETWWTLKGVTTTARDDCYRDMAKMINWWMEVSLETETKALEEPVGYRQIKNWSLITVMMISK